MAEKTPGTRGKAPKRVTLKTLAEHLGLSLGTISIALNDTPAAQGLRPETRQRVRDAAQELGYQPNELARSLRKQRSQQIGVLIPRIKSHYANGVVSGLEEHLSTHGYTYLVSSHHHDVDTLNRHVRTLVGRQIDGLVLVAAPQVDVDAVPTVTVAGRRKVEFVPDVGIDHDHAATQGLQHLADHGHQHIAFFKGHQDSPDTSDRWRAILQQAGDLGLEIDPRRCRHLGPLAASRSRSSRAGYEEGYALGRSLLEDGGRFTALFAFNDLSAIGAMRAFLDAGKRVPEDISVIGFDDIDSSAFFRPSLTTLRQPLDEMGRRAGRRLLAKLEGQETSEEQPLRVRAELVVRESTGPAPSTGAV